MEDHMKYNRALHLKQLQATVEVRLALPSTVLVVRRQGLYLIEFITLGQAQKARIAQLEEERQVADQAPPKHGSFLPHFSLRVVQAPYPATLLVCANSKPTSNKISKWVMVVLYLAAVLVAVLAGVLLIAKLVVTGLQQSPGQCGACAGASHAGQAGCACRGLPSNPLRPSSSPCSAPPP